MLAWADSITLGSQGEMVSVPMSRGGTQDEKEGLLRRNVELVKFPKELQFDSFDKLNNVVLLVEEESRKLCSGSFFEGPFGVYYIGGSTNGVPVDKLTRPAHLAGTTHVSRSMTSNMLPSVSGVSRASGVSSDMPSLNSGISPSISGTSSATVLSQSVTGPNPKICYSSPRSEISNEPEPSSPQESETSLDLEFRLGQEEPETSIFSETDNSYVHYDLLDSAKLTILAIKGPRFEFSEQSMFHILYPKFFPNIESDEWLPDSKVLLNYFEACEGGGVTVKPLLSECTNYLRSSMISFVRVARANDAWDLWVVPLIKNVIYELVCEDYSRNSNWRSHFISKSAMDVSRELLIRNIKLAIICMAFASSAFQKSLSKTKRHKNAVNAYFLDDEMRRSIELRKLGINILNYHLDEYDNNCEFPTNDSYDTYLLLALTLQIQLDNAYSVFENYELLFAIGDFILKRKLSHSFSPVEKYLRNIFHILNVFYETTQAINLFNFSISEKDKKLKYLDLNNNYDLTKCDTSDEKDDASGSDSESVTEGKQKGIRVAALTDKSHLLSFTVYFNKSKTDSERSGTEEPTAAPTSYAKVKDNMPRPMTNPIIPQVEDSSIYLSLGLPKSLIQLFHEVTQLTNHKNVFRTKGVTPRNFPRICAEMEDKIINWNVENYWKLYDSKYNSISNVTTKRFISKFHEGLYYNVTSFQNALLVYYKRLIPMVPIQNYQNLIENSLDAMEKLLKLNAALKGEVRFSPSFWPLLICGCDIDLPRREDLQIRCQELWKYECFKKYNYWRSKQILYEVWSRRTQGGENNGFMDMIREWDIVLCLG